MRCSANSFDAGVSIMTDESGEETAADRGGRRDGVSLETAGLSLIIMLLVIGADEVGYSPNIFLTACGVRFCSCASFFEGGGPVGSFFLFLKISCVLLVSSYSSSEISPRAAS